MKNQTRHLIVLVLLSTLNLQPSAGRAQDAVFTYQGQVLDNGTNFTGNGQFKFALVTSTNTSRQATATATVSGGFLTIVTVTSGGAGYVSAPAVTVSGGGGSGAVLTANISGGVVTNVTVNNPGDGYTSSPTITIAAPPADIAGTTYWSNDGTSSAGSEPATAVNLGVANGLFTVVLGDTTLSNMTAFSAGLFEQPNLQLQIWFSDGTNGFAALNPARSLTPAPYAAFANRAGYVSGTVSNAQLANSSITVNAGTGFSGGGTVALGGSTTLNNTGVLSVTGNADITASTVGGAVTLGDTGTSANTASTIVKRDGASSFSATTLTLGGNLNLPATTSTSGIIYSGGSTLMHSHLEPTTSSPVWARVI